MSSKYYIGRDVMSFEDNGERLPISRVTLLLDGQTGYTSGDDTGAEFTAECYFATQEMADSILARLQGHTYKAFSAGSANLDPAAELGDGVTVGGIYSTISSLSDDGNGFPDVSAPGERELEDEYPGGSPLMRSIDRSLATVRAELRVDIDSITSTVEGLEGNISKIDQRVDSITLSVSSKDGSTTFTLEADGATLSTKTLDLSVDAVNINGRLTADQIDATNLTVKAANITGPLTIGQLPDSVATSDEIPTKTSELTNDSGYEDATGIVSIIDGTVTADFVEALGVRARYLSGSTVYLEDGPGNTVCTISLDPEASSTEYAVEFFSTNGGYRFDSESGDIYLIAHSMYGDYGATVLQLHSDFISVECDYFTGYGADLGTNSNGGRWSNIYLSNEPTVASDLNLKKDIIYGLAEYDALYDRLEPVSFLFKNGTSGRRHIGMIAQDVEATLAELGIDTKDFAGFVKSPARDEDGNIIEGEYNYALRYGEWISLNIWQIQQLKARVAELEAAVYG